MTAADPSEEVWCVVMKARFVAFIIVLNLRAGLKFKDKP